MHKVMRSPRSLDLEITSHCNASCSYCYYLNNSDVSYKDLPTAAWLDLFDELGRCQVMDVTLLGGEPLLRDDFFTLIDGVVANRMRFSILSNGSMLTPESAGKIKATGRCDQVQISLDGSRAEIHEIMRGQGSFLPALAAIRNLQDAEIPVTARVTVHTGNIDDLPEIARLLLVDLNLPSFSTNAVSSLGSSAKYDAGMFLSAVQRLRAMQLLAELEAQYPGRIKALAGPLAEWHMFHEMRRAHQSGQPVPERGRLVGCGCVFDRLAVRADGAYIPCVVLPQMVLGRIGANSLRDVWHDAEILNDLRKRTRIGLGSFMECRGCEYLLSCTGNCAGGAFSLLGDANRPSPDACLRNFERDLAKEGLSLP